MTKRDEFSRITRLKLAQRAQFVCSFPGCGITTIGPGSSTSASVSTIGVAAHIHAAAPGGKRYLVTMTEHERKSIDNGIWVCQNHGALLDEDELIYTADKIRAWKRDHESRAEEWLHGGLRRAQLHQPLGISWQFDKKEPWDLALQSELPSAPDPIPADFSAYDWLLSAGAGQYLETRLQLFLTNLTGTSLLLTEMKVHVEASVSFEGALVSSETAGARKLEVIVFDLEAANPRPNRGTIEEDGTLKLEASPDFFQTGYFSIAPYDVQGFLIVGRVATALAKWKILITTLSDGRQSETIIDNDGAPFITTGKPGNRFGNHYNWEWWRGEGRRFNPVNPLMDVHSQGDR